MLSSEKSAWHKIPTPPLVRAKDSTSSVLPFPNPNRAFEGSVELSRLLLDDALLGPEFRCCASSTSRPKTRPACEP